MHPHPRPMARRVVLTLTLALAAVTLPTLGPGPVRARQATPAAATAQVTKETLGSGRSAAAPGRDLLLQRRTFPAGSTSGAHPAPGPVVLVVERGTVGFTVVQGAAMVTRAGPGGSAGGPAESLAVGTEAQLHAGDAVSYDQGVVHTVRNAGTDQAVTLEARLNPSGGVAGASTPGASPAAAAGAQPNAVAIKDFAFTPQTLAVPAGTTVIWTNGDSTAHTVTGDKGEFDSGPLDPGKSYRETLATPGTYAYHCQIHPGMKATIVVT